MLMQHIGVGYFGYYRATAYAMKHSLMPEIAKLRMKALNFWDKHGIRAATDAFDVSTRTLYWWRRLLRTGGPEALIQEAKPLWFAVQGTGILMYSRRSGV